MAGERIINQLFYQWWKLRREPLRDGKDLRRSQPLFVCGMFRSGTSLLAGLLCDNGFDSGPENHLLHGIGKRSHLNPDGFRENYLFMEWSMFYMKKHRVDGASLSTPERWLSPDEMKTDRDEFARFCLLEECDDRISNRNKIAVLEKYDPSNLDLYIHENFGRHPLIKNPHFSLFFPVLLRQWPGSRLLFVFQDPHVTLSSVNEKMLAVKPELYSRYYQEALDSDDSRIGFFDLDGLFRDRESSLHALSAFTGLSLNSETPDYRKKVSTKGTLILPASVRETYESLRKKSMNPIR